MLPVSRRYDRSCGSAGGWWPAAWLNLLRGNLWMLPCVEIFSDGACRGNPGPGGWGALLRHKRKEKTLSGAEPQTTNNRMELMAAIRALESLKRQIGRASCRERE